MVGLGTQGKKRLSLLGKQVVATVDPNTTEATFAHIEEVPNNIFDSAFLCVPDGEKIRLINFLTASKKHILVEKPLNFRFISEIESIQENSRLANTFIYTAYNHRFEPNIIKMKNLLNEGFLGEIYSVRIFYGNGTAKLVRESNWRDVGLGVVNDLAPHILDTIAFWFGELNISNLIVNNERFENSSPDHSIIHGKYGGIALTMEMSLCSWKNTFQCEIIGRNGSAHIDNLCKWGPSTFNVRKRKLPSGLPEETFEVTEMKDPTWGLEHNFFSESIAKRIKTNLSKDIWIQNMLSQFSAASEK
jgi:predicted dehydrogenase